MKSLLFLLLSVSVTYAFEVFSPTAKYEVSNISKKLSEEYNADLKMKSVVVIANKRAQANYKKQWEILHSIDAEQYRLVYIDSVSEDPPITTYGYYTTKDTAVELLEGNEFLIKIYSPEGNVLVSSKKILSSEKIIELLKK